jgi:CDP-diacylglycerol---glycerol-3-phosphate 3-phosphatidyltransferase
VRRPGHGVVRSPTRSFSSWKQWFQRDDASASQDKQAEMRLEDLDYEGDEQLSENRAEDGEQKLTEWIHMQDQTQRDQVWVQSVIARLSGASCGIPVRGDDVHIVGSPNEFYQTLLHGIRTATRRIELSSLYLGHADYEQTIIQALIDRCHEIPDLQVRIILDANRGADDRHDEPSSQRVIQPLLDAFPSRAKLVLFNAWKRKLRHKLLRGRALELFGVFHMKVYRFDDDVMLSGANLSQIYFEQRHDRYVLVRNTPHLASLYEDLNDILEELAPRGDVSLSETHDVMFRFLDLLMASDPEIRKEYRKQRTDPSYDTMLFPSVHGPEWLGIKHDNEIVQRLVAGGSVAGARLDLCTGYANFNTDMLNLLEMAKYDTHIVAGSARSNGWNDGKGMYALIPQVYVTSMNRTLKWAQNCQSTHVYEYDREGWSFHGKGIWISPSDPNKPRATMFGSSNFGSRSAELDVESNIALVTTNDSLSDRLREERDMVLKYAQPASQQSTSLLVQVIALIMRPFM